MSPQTATAFPLPVQGDGDARRRDGDGETRGRRRPRVLTPGRVEIERVQWDDHFAYLDKEWRPGDHCSVIAPTDWGKSHLIRRGLLPLWEHARVIVIDPTDDDKQYRTGFRAVRGMPGRLQRMGFGDNPQWYRLVPEFGIAGRDATRDVLAETYREGRWVVIIDETRQVTDARAPAYGLAAYYVQLMMRARKRKVTVLSATQEPVWMPSSFYTQPKHIYIGRILDKRSRTRLQEIAGADTDDLVQIIGKLGKYEYLYVGPNDRLEIVKAPAA